MKIKTPKLPKPRLIRAQPPQGQVQFLATLVINGVPQQVVVRVEGGE